MFYQYTQLCLESLEGLQPWDLYHKTYYGRNLRFTE